ncbi:MAG: sugar transferase [Planctomycetes bacterium]|nr:sugar transferase [Planctomycetota bacterium]MCB9903609.1 sugar transferase [Planctomycetota bacterium]
MTPVRSSAPAEALLQPAPSPRAATVTQTVSAPHPVKLDQIEQLRRAVAAVDWDAISPTGMYARYGRRALDVATVFALLPLAAIPAACVVLANLFIFRDPRKVFFTQERVGYRGEVFRMYKFRTMRDARRGALHSWSSGGDRLRVTRFGRFLRNAHLDELPQLVNILRGEMGIIGPRPEMVEIEAWAAREVPAFVERLRIRPGVTGWAQITQGYTGRCREAYAAKLAANEAVTCRPSLRRDVEILARTALWMLRGKGWEWKLQGSPRPRRSA